MALSEAQEQANVIKWSQQAAIRQKWPELSLLHHIPNGGNRDAVTGRNLKQAGVKRGVPDLCLPVPRGQYHGLYVEMKAIRGHTSPEQEWWGEQLRKQGYCWQVCHGWESAIQTLEGYLTLQGGQNDG